MKIINLGEKTSILNQYLAEIRDTTIQKDSMRFRRNMERMGEIFAYEISKTLTYEKMEVRTPLGIAQSDILTDNVIISSILRAGIPVHQGVLNYFDKAQNAFIAAYRKYGKDNKFEIKLEYAASPNIDDKVLILSDSMIATGASIELTYENLLLNGTPKVTHVVAPIASALAVENLQKSVIFKDVVLWVGAIDEELTNKSYIVPGLGDAGDLAYGSKL